MKSPVKSFLNTLLVAVCLMSLAATGQQEDPLRAHPVLHRDGVFTIRAVDRPYDLHRPRPVTTLAIEHRDWPGNWFSLWLPETVYEGERNVWSNFTGGERTQRWTTETNGTLIWRMLIGRFELTSTLTPDAENNALWISHEFRNTSSEPLRLLSTQSCFHLVDAPQFISAFGERIWAKLDGEWMTTDRVDRLASPDPRRVSFCRHGLRPARVVKPFQDFPSAELLEEAHHPLIIAEAFGGKGAVGIGQRDYHHLFNNNDPILRCIHSEPKPIAALEPGARAVQEGLIVFDRGDHAALVKRWERLARKRWGTAGEEARGPLRAHPTNPRYFTDGTGKAIFLTGSHTWDSLQDWGGPTPNFDYSAYLDLLSGHGHNFTRLWIWESTGGNTSRSNAIAPMPWARTDPGVAADGEPKFDLDRFNDAFFDRLRSRVMAARDRGIYVSIMLFQQYFNLRTHPFAASNNVNGLSADLNGDGDGREIHTLGHPAALACQEAFVRKVIDAVNDLDNVLYEIGNEFERHTIEWQHHMINLIHAYEREKPKQHPVGMTSTGRSGTAPPRITNAELFASPADWISPHNERGQNYASDPPAADGRKIVLADSDHLEGILGATDAETYRRWIWKSLFRGVHPMLMDAIQNGIPGWEKEAWNQTSNPALPAAREAMGRARAYAERLELAALVPRSDLASTRYCLAIRGKEYVVFLPEGGEATVDLSAASGKFAVEWYRVEDGKSQAGDNIVGGKEIQLASPWSEHDVVLRLVRKSEASP